MNKIIFISFREEIREKEVSIFLSQKEDEKLTKFFFDTYQEEIEKFDKEIIPYLEILNKTPGIVTCYSCTGHKRKEDRGYILFYVSEDMFLFLVEEIFPYLYNRFLNLSPTALDLGFNYLEEKVRIHIAWDHKYFKDFMDVFTYELLLSKE